MRAHNKTLAGAAIRVSLDYVSVVILAGERMDASLRTQAATRLAPDPDLIDFPVARNSAKIGIR